MWAKSIFAMGLITTFIDLQCCQLSQNYITSLKLKSILEFHKFLKCISIFAHNKKQKSKLATLWYKPHISTKFILPLYCTLLTHIDLYWNDLSNSLVDLWNLPYNLIEMVKNILFKQSDFFPAAKAIKKAKVKMQKRRFFYFTGKKKTHFEAEKESIWRLLEPVFPTLRFWKWTISCTIISQIIWMKICHLPTF